MERRVLLAAYLAHTRRADGTWRADWAVARLTVEVARQALQQHMTHAELPQELTEAAHAASEDMRQGAFVTADWQQVQAQILRVVPVVQQLLRAVAVLDKSG